MHGSMRIATNMLFASQVTQDRVLRAADFIFERQSSQVRILKYIITGETFVRGHERNVSILVTRHRANVRIKK